MERCRKHPFIANLPSEARTIFHAGFGMATGRSSDLQAWPIKNDRCFYWPIFPVSEKTSGNWVFDPANRCGAVPDSHRVPFRRSPRERHQQALHNIKGR